MASATYQIVRDAIQKRLHVIATYDGRTREMCPHTIGMSKKGEEQALFYQFAGESKSGLGPDGDPNNWRCVTLRKLSNVTTREGAWHTAPNHTRLQTCVADVDIEVPY
jgi:hypothetical protein